MHIAYIISAYKYPEQLIRLVRVLHTPSAAFYIHVDKKTDDGVYEQMQAGVRDLDHIVFLERHACHWGDFGHVRATLKGITALMQHGVPFDYAILLTAQDYPIKSNAVIEQRLSAYPGRQYMRYFPLPAANWVHGGINRLTNWYVTLFGRRYVFPSRQTFRYRFPPRAWAWLARLYPLTRRFPEGLQPYGGGSYWCLTRDCLAYVDDVIRRRPDLVRFFKHVHVPDELFFQTILMNSPFKESVVNDDLRFILWPTPAKHPTILRTEHLEALLASDKLFARKFDATVDAEILHLIDQAIA